MDEPENGQTDTASHEQKLSEFHVEATAKEVDPWKLERREAGEVRVTPHDKGLKTGIGRDSGGKCEHSNDDINWK